MKLRPCGRNSVRIEDGIAYVDVSTKTFPDCVAKIDTEDLPLILDGNGRWHAWKGPGSLTVYVVRRHRGLRIGQNMHRIIFRAASEIDIDHVNRDGLDNRRLNLRPATQAENTHNRAGFRGSSSRYKGVHLASPGGKWRAAITYAGRTLHLGRLLIETEAAKAYDAAARRLYGEFAYTNFGEPA